MAETLKQTQDKLKAQIARLRKDAAKETDIAKKAALKAQARALNNQLKSSKQESALDKNLSVVEKAKKELERLNALDPNTPGIAPAKTVQQKIIDDATKKGLPKPEVKKKVEPTIVDTTASKAAAKKKVTTPVVEEQLKPTPKPMPITTPGVNSGAVGAGGAGGFTDSQNAARITATGTKTATGVEDINAIYTLAKDKYGNVDSIFLYDPELKKLLIDAVGDPTTAKDDMDAAEFGRRLGASDWAIRNASTYAKRDAERRQYTETLDKYNQQLELADTQEKKDAILSKIGQLKTTSAYARGLASAKAFIELTASGLTGTMSPERLDAFVKRMYDSAKD